MSGDYKETRLQIVGLNVFIWLQIVGTSGYRLVSNYYQSVTDWCPITISRSQIGADWCLVVPSITTYRLVSNFYKEVQIGVQQLQQHHVQIGVQ